MPRMYSRQPMICRMNPSAQFSGAPPVCPRLARPPRRPRAGPAGRHSCRATGASGRGTVLPHHRVLVVAEAGQPVLDPVRERAPRLAAVRREPERPRLAEMIAEPCLDQLQHLLDRLVGREAHRSRRRRPRPAAACGSPGRSSTRRPPARRPPSAGRSRGASRDRRTPSAGSCGPPPRRRSGGASTGTGRPRTGAPGPGCPRARRSGETRRARSRAPPPRRAPSARRRSSPAMRAGVFRIVEPGVGDGPAIGRESGRELAHRGEDRKAIFLGWWRT